MGFRNLPTDAAASLDSLIDAKPGCVSSMGLAQPDDPVAFTLLAFAEGESVSEEEYPGDTFYLVVEGMVDIVLPDRSVPMHMGDVLHVPAGVLHAVEPKGALKLLQVSYI